MRAGWLWVAWATGLSSAQAAERRAHELLERRQISAVRVEAGSVRIDGRLSEAAWASAPVARRFVQSAPDPGAEATLSTEFRVLVDDHALYIGVRLLDPQPDRITATLGRRDDENVSDWCFVEIDSRFDHRSGFSFGLNPGGVQVDGVWSNDVDYDSSWNAVWESTASVDAKGWTAEFRIPFSQLAFSLPPGASTLSWGLNVYRFNPRTGEVSNW
jgi:hypothetical protein